MQGNNNDQTQRNNQNMKNYLKPLKKYEDELPKTQMKEKEDLHAILHKLKNYYNELNKLKKRKLTQLNELKDKHNGLNKQIEDKLAFSDIEFPNERITIEDYEKFKDSKETRESIQIKIENLISEKEQLLLKYENEIEYGNKINNLIKIEKRNYYDVYEHILQTQEKIGVLKGAHKDLEINKEEKIKKEKIFTKVKKELDIEMLKLDDVIDYQTKNYYTIVAELKMKNEQNQQKLKEIEIQDVNLDVQHKKSSEKILSEIQKSKMVKSQNTEKESYVIKLILGLDIIKRYFIDVVKQGKEINTVELMKSEDFKTFNSEKFSIRENNYESGISQNQLSDAKANSSEMNNFKSSNINNTTAEDEKAPGRGKISLKSLKEKLDNLDIDYDKIYDFYTKIMNKTNFFHNHMINFNLKQISLEGKKEEYTQRVRQIISKNPKNIQDLKTYDAKFDYLFRNFEKEIKTTNLYENLNSKIKDFDANPSQHIDFYRKCSKYMSDVKTFYEFLIFNFKRIKIDCPDEILKGNISRNYKAIKSNIRSEKNSADIEKINYIRDLFKNIELEYLKENKKLEKILRAIEEYPDKQTQSRAKTQTNINKIENINNQYELDNSKNDEISNCSKNIKELEVNSSKNNINNLNTNEKEECMENSQILSKNMGKQENNSNYKKNNLEFKYLDSIESRKMTTNMENLNTFENNTKILSTIKTPNQENQYSNNIINSNNNLNNFNNNNIKENLPTKKNSAHSNQENSKSDVSNNLNPIDLVSGFPYISPYSGWSISKLEEEREESIKKVELLKNQMLLGKQLEDKFNLNNLIILNVPFEKTLFYFFENLEKIVDNIKLSKSTTNLCSKALLEDKTIPLDLDKKNSSNNSPDSKLYGLFNLFFIIILYFFLRFFLII